MIISSLFEDQLRRTFLLFVSAICLVALRSGDAAAQFAARLDSVIASHVRDEDFSGVVVVSDKGRAIFSRAIGMANREWLVPMTEDAVFRIGSTTKQFTAAIIFKLVEQGKLRLDDRIVDHLPDYPAVSGSRITLRHLLSHTSGIPDYVSRDNFFATQAAEPHSATELLSRFDTLPLEFEPGSKWNYSNSGYVVLAVIAEKITGRPYDALLREFITTPLHLTSLEVESDAVVQRRVSAYMHFGAATIREPYVNSSSAYGAGVLESRASDLVQWAHALMEGRVFTPEVAKQYLHPEMATGLPLGSYAHGLFIGSYILGGRSHIVWQHGGTISGSVTGFWMLPEEDRAIVVLSNTRGKRSAELAAELAEALYR